MIYITTLALCKISILLFYLRIFPSRAFRIICQTIAAATIVYTIVFLFLTLFQCTPVAYIWEGWQKASKGECRDPAVTAYVSAAINIALDFSILLLPVPWLVKLHVSLKRKLNVLLMFSIGVL